MSVKVAVRTRPLNANEIKDGSSVIIRMNGNEVDVTNSGVGSGRQFRYDSALWSTGTTVNGSTNPEATQETVYQAIGAEMLEHTLTGYNGCIFAYGQTGSGKTYCMMGLHDNPGIVPRLADNLFAETERLRQSESEVCVEVSYYEIYCEKVRCLLRPTKGGFDDSTLRVREHPKFGPFIEGLAKFVVSSQTEFLQLMNDGNKVRTTASTAMNATSSRSHAVFTITLTQKKKKGKFVTTTTSKLNLVDLAGSERASKTMATGQRLAEGAKINTSLTCLGNVISALAEVEETGKERHIPYRDSILTWILKDNLGGNSKTIMLATISPSSAQYEETMSTLRYAERAKKIMNKAVVNESNNNEVIAALQKEIANLKLQLDSASTAERSRLQEELAASEAVQKELSSSLEEKLAETKKMMEEREKYMKELEDKLKAQSNEIEDLKRRNDEKEEKIAKLLAQINALTDSAAASSSGSAAAGSGETAADKMREQVAALEQEQNVAETRIKDKQRVADSADAVDGDDDAASIVLEANRPREDASADDRGEGKRAEKVHFDEHDADAPAALKQGVRQSIAAQEMMTAATEASAAVKQNQMSSSTASSPPRETDESDGAFDLDLDSLDDFDIPSDAEETAADAPIGEAASPTMVDGDLQVDTDIELDDDEVLEVDDDIVLDDDEAVAPPGAAPATSATVNVGNVASTAAAQTAVAPGAAVAASAVPPTAAHVQAEQVHVQGGQASALPSQQQQQHTQQMQQMQQQQPQQPQVALQQQQAQHALSPSQPQQQVQGSVQQLSEPATQPVPSGDKASAPQVPSAVRADQLQPVTNSVLETQQQKWVMKAASALQQWAKTDAKPEIFAPASNIVELVVPSHALPNNRYLHEPFKVVKMKESSILSHRKDRVWDIDFFAHSFGNYDVNGNKSFALLSAQLFRVELDPVHARRLVLYFFEAPHPYELEFTSVSRRRRFYELATLQRRSSILWCPSLCLDGENDVAITVRGTTIERPNRVVRVNGEAKFTVARMPYEVMDFWYGCFSLQGCSGLPRNAAVLGSFIPKGVHDLYIVGVTDVPGSLIGNDEIGQYLVSYLGAEDYYAIGTTTMDVQKRKNTHNAMLIICRRSFIPRISRVQMMEAPTIHRKDVSKDDFTAVGCALNVNEATICAILVNTKSTSCSAQTRNMCLRSLLTSFTFGDPSLDIASRFDYLVVSGKFGFGGGTASFSAEDPLTQQIKLNNVMSSLQESEPSATLKIMRDPMRVLYSVRPRVSRMDVGLYTTSRAVAVSNVYFTADVFTQRTYLSVFGEVTPRVQLIFDKMTIMGERLPDATNVQIVITGDFFESAPLTAPTVKQAARHYTAAAAAVPIVYPTVSNTEFLRLQTINFAVIGCLGTAHNKPTTLASGSLPLKNVAQLGESKGFAVPLYFHTCLVGALQGSLLQIYDEKNYAEVASAGLSRERFVSLVSCFENQIRQGSSWVPASAQPPFTDFSAKDPSTPQRRESFQLPDAQSWRWLTEWQHEGRADDSEGWIYSDGGGAPLQLKEGKHSTIRRRRWTRAMQAQDASTLHEYLTFKFEQMKENAEQ